MHKVGAESQPWLWSLLLWPVLKAFSSLCSVGHQVAAWHFDFVILSYPFPSFLLHAWMVTVSDNDVTLDMELKHLRMTQQKDEKILSPGHHAATILAPQIWTAYLWNPLLLYLSHCYSWALVLARRCCFWCPGRARAGWAPCVPWLSCLAVLLSWPHRSCVWNCLSVCTWVEIQSHNNFKAVSLCPEDSCSPLPSHFHQRTKRWLVNNSLSLVVYSIKHNSHSTECYNVNILLNLF